MNGNTIYEVIKKLIGPIDPIGESNSDEIRYENLNTALEVVNRLMSDICYLIPKRKRVEYSISRSGSKAFEYAKNLRDSLNDDIEEG